ncbi:MAG TPA: HAMP domain-containing protein, partial [bacterium]|nr:HAMP domain-containing protein [bacterium]
MRRRDRRNNVLMLYGAITGFGIFLGLVFPLLDKVQTPSPLWFYVICVSCGICAAALILLIVQKIVLKPLEEFLNAMEKVTKGDLSVSIHGHHTGDFEALAQNFNMMIEYLRSSVVQLKK